MSTNNREQKSPRRLKAEVQSLVRSVVTFQRPSAEELEHCTRAEKYRRLREHNGLVRARLLAWIDEHGLSNEVIQVSEPTAFNTLFIVGTRRAIDELVQAPDVIDVAEDGDVTTDLPRPEE